MIHVKCIYNLNYLLGSAHTFKEAAGIFCELELSRYWILRIGFYEKYYFLNISASMILILASISEKNLCPCNLVVIEDRKLSESILFLSLKSFRVEGC